MSVIASQLIAAVSVTGVVQAERDLLRMAAASDSAGAKLGVLAAGSAVVAGAVLLGLGAKAVSMAGDFEQAVNRLKTGGGDIQDSFNSLWTGIQKVATATGVLTGPLSQAMYLIVSSGQRGAQAMDTLRVAAQGAQIEQAKVADVTQILTTLQTNFGLTTHSAAQYMDGLVAAVKDGKISLENLSTAMSPILPLAASMHVHFQDVAAAMSDMTNMGLPATQAATGLRDVFTSIEKPTAAAEKAMKQYGVSSQQVAQVMQTSLPDAFQLLINAAKKAGPEGSQPFIDALSSMVGGGQRTAKVIAALDTSMQQWRRTIGDVNAYMKDASSNVIGWDTAQSNFNVKLDQAKATVQVLGENIGAALLPVLGTLLDNVPKLATSFGDWATATDGLMGYINQLTAFVTYLWQDLSNNGALQEFGSILSDIGQTVQNVLNTALATLATIFGTTATNAGKASDAATNVANGFKRLLDTIKPVTDAISWLTQQFADAGPKGQILRDVLITIGGAIAGIKIAEFAPGFVKAMTDAATATKGFGLQLVGLQTQANATATSVAGVGTAASSTTTAAGGLKTSFANLGLAMGPIIGIATGVRLALGALPSTMPGIHDMGAQIDKTTMSFGGWVHIVQDGNQVIQQQTQQMALIASRNFESMYKNATNSTMQLKSGVTIELNQLKDGTTETIGSMDEYVRQRMAHMGDQSSAYVRNMHDQIVTDWFNMHTQVYTQTDALSSQAIGLIDQLHDNVIGDFQNMDSQAIGYWNDVAAYIAGHPINGNITYTVQGAPISPGGPVGAASHHNAAGTSYAPGGWSWVGEYGPELINIPRGAQILPHNQSMSMASSPGPGDGRPIILQIDGRTFARAILPHLTNEIRYSVGTRGL